MKTQLYTIEPISNLHVGNGEINTGIIDNLIQRDFLTKYPIILSSSLKGALREYFSLVIPESEEHKQKATGVLSSIFGNDIKSNASRQGTYKFFDAQLLSIPVRCDRTIYANITCPQLIKNFLLNLKLFKIEINQTLINGLKEIVNTNYGHPVGFCDDIKGAKLNLFYKDVDVIVNDPIPLDKSMLSEISILFGDKPLVVISDKKFFELCDDNHLPVIARNCLIDSISDNIWYEQILPRFSKLYFIVMPNEKTFENFNNIISSDLVQIGANATVGYGYCTIKHISNI